MHSGQEVKRGIDYPNRQSREVPIASDVIQGSRAEREREKKKKRKERNKLINPEERCQTIVAGWLLVDRMETGPRSQSPGELLAP